MTRPLRTLFPVLALLLLLVGAGLVLGAGTPVAASGVDTGTVQSTDEEQLLFQPVEIGPNTTRMLELDSVAESGTGSGSVSVTNALQAESVAVESELDRRAVEDRLARSPVDSERILSAAVTRTEDRVDALAARERGARDRFSTGEVGSEAYLATVGEVNRVARTLESTVDTYEGLADGHTGLEDRLAAAQTETVRYTGPVAEEAGTAVAGGGDTETVFVAVSEGGMTLSAIRDETYVRETMRTDARDDEVGGVDLDAAQSRIAELYPWAWEHKGDVSINTVGQDVFRFQLSHGHGVLNSLLDTSSGNVYREVQTKSLSNLPVVAGQSVTVDNTTLQLSRARAGSPLRIQVVNETGSPIQATVTANGRTLETTGDEPAWLLAPGGTFNVTAETADTELELEVTPE